MSEPTPKMVTLRSSSGEEFAVEEALVSEHSPTIKYLIDDSFSPDKPISLPYVTSKALLKIIEYCKKHRETTKAARDKASTSSAPPPSGAGGEELREWDEELVEAMEQDNLYDLALAANYLDMKSLFELACETVVKLTRVYSLEEIREIFAVPK